MNCSDLFDKKTQLLLIFFHWTISDTMWKDNNLLQAFLSFSVWCQSHRMSALCKISSTLILVSDRHLLPCFALLQVKRIGINVHDTGSVIITCHYCLSYISVSMRFRIRGMEERISFLLKRMATHKFDQFKRYFINTS